MASYTIKDLENLSGIKAHTIRIWEQRYGLLKPQRTATNIRYYSDYDLRYLLNVAMLVKSGNKISRVALMNSDELSKEVINSGRQEKKGRIDLLVMHTLNMNEPGIHELLEQLMAKDGFNSVFQEVVFPFIEKIGLLWQTGSMLTVHEHFASNLIRNRILAEIERLQVSEGSQTVLFFLKENEWHELGLLYYNYLAKSKGFRTIYLGSNLPYIDLQKMKTTTRFDVVFTAFVNAFEKRNLEKYLEKIADDFRSSHVLITGRQVQILQPKIPTNVRVIESPNDFNLFIQECYKG